MPLDKVQAFHVERSNNLVVIRVGGDVDEFVHGDGHCARDDLSLTTQQRSGCPACSCWWCCRRRSGGVVIESYVQRPIARWSVVHREFVNLMGTVHGSVRR